MFEYAGVHILKNPFHIDNTFDYYIPPDLRDKILSGLPGQAQEGDFGARWRVLGPEEEHQPVSERHKMQRGERLLGGCGEGKGGEAPCGRSDPASR